MGAILMINLSLKHPHINKKLLILPVFGFLLGCTPTPVINSYTAANQAIRLGDYLYAFGDVYSFKNEALTGVKISFTDTVDEQNSCIIATSEVNEGLKNTQFRFEIICENVFSYFDIFEEKTFEYKRTVNYNFYWINFATKWNTVSTITTVSSSTDENYQLHLNYPGITFTYPDTITPYYPRVVSDTTNERIDKLDEFLFFESYFNESIQVINRWLTANEFSILNFKLSSCC